MTLRSQDFACPVAPPEADGMGSPVRPVQVVAGEGLEPSRPCGQWILSPSRLPIPPPGHQLYGINLPACPAP